MIGAWVGRAEGAGGNGLVNDSRTWFSTDCFHFLFSRLLQSLQTSVDLPEEQLNQSPRCITEPSRAV
jgi:hypothetical protein